MTRPDTTPLLDWVPFGLFRADETGALQEANPALAGLLEYESPESLHGRPVATLFQDATRWSALVRQMESGAEVDSEMAMLRSTQDVAIPVLLSCRTERKDGVLMYEGVVQDIRERFMLERELRQAQKLDAIGRLAGGMAHDFNNLLMIVQGRAELALRSLTLNAPAMRHLYAIHHTAAQAQTLTQQLLAFSRNQTLTLRVVSPNEIVEESRELISRWLGDDIVFETHLGSELWPVRSDPVQLQQVIVNLVLNARDAMPEGGRLRLRSANVTGHDFGGPEDDGRDAVLIEVEDTGAGMDEQTLALIFEPFFTTKQKGQGTGLGLSTAYGVIRQSGGHIQVKSRPGEGALFRIFLPRAEGAIQPFTGTYSRPRGPIQPVTRRGVILLVEDEDDLRTVIQTFLEDMGHQVVARRDAEGALQYLAASEPPDLLLTDVLLPAMNGVELAQQIRAAWTDLPIVYMTGFLDHKLVRDIRESGAHILSKPFTQGRLDQVVRQELETFDPRPAGRS